jgi:hypothetical protein
MLRANLMKLDSELGEEKDSMCPYDNNPLR